MPHIILNYTSNLSTKDEFSQLFSGIHKVLSNLAGIDLAKCKSRTNKLKNYYIGEGEKSGAFANLELHIFKGRTIDQKQRIGNEVLSLLKKHFQNDHDKLNIQYTLEIIEMNPNLYFKA